MQLGVPGTAALPGQPVCRPGEYSVTTALHVSHLLACLQHSLNGFALDQHSLLLHT